MESGDTVVPTSDHEELEELAATNIEYWRSATRDIARRRNDIVVAADNGTPSRHAVGAAAREVGHRPPRTPPSVDRPRKRRKLEEDQHASAESLPLVSSTNLPRPLSSHGPAQSAPILHMPSRSSTPSDVYPFKTTPAGEPTNDFSPSPLTWSPRHYIDNTPTPDAPDEASNAPSANAERTGSPSSRPFSELKNTLVQKPSTESPASSPDPIALFTPPRPRPVSLGISQLRVVSPLSSPLTLTSSPAKRLSREHTPSPGPSRIPQHLQSPVRVTAEETAPFRESAQIQLVTGLSEAANLAAQFAEHHDGRYSLRARKARQLNPYEYDKQLYKRQMRANPEAIVKVVSPLRPRRRHRSTSTGVREVGGSSGAEDEYEAGEEDEGLDEDARWERRMMKAKARAANPPQSDDEPLGAPREKPTRYPAAFDESPSGSSTEEEDATLDALQRQRERERRQKEKEERLKKRKPRPFPLHKKDLQPVTLHPPDQAEESPPRPHPKPRPRPRGASQLVQGQVDAHSAEREVRSSQEHRQRSITFTSPTRGSPGSAPALAVDDVYTGWGDDFAQPDNLLQPVSPVPLPPTPVVTDEGASSEAHVPPSSTPPDFIDISSDSDDALDLPLRRPPRRRSRSHTSNPALDSSAESESGSQLSSSSIDETDRKRMKVLQRMMPAVLIKRLEQKAARPPPPRHSVDRERSRGREDGSSDEEERPLRPGETRRRIRTQSNRSIEIRGDSESSDINIDVDANDPQSPTAGLAPLWPEEEIMPIAHRPRPRTGTSHRTVTADISLSEDSADSVLSDSAESISDDEVGNGRAPRRPRHDGEAREGDLIDRMLSRTRVVSRKRPKRKRRTGHGATRRQGNGRSHRRHGAASGHGYRGHGAGAGIGGGDGGGGGHGGGGGRGGGLHFSTGGAKRYGSGRQTLLPFKRLPTPEQPQQRDAMPADPSSPTNEVRFEQEVPHKTKPKLKKHKPQTKLTGLYVFGSGGAHIVSGRANSGHVTVDQEAEAASYARDAPAPPGRTSRSHSKRSRVSSAVDHPVTLDEFWALAGAEESDDSFVVPDAPVPQAASSQQRNILEHLNRVTVDLDVQPLPAGIAFPNTTYLGRGWLYELIHLLSGDQETPSPPSCSMFDCYLHYDMSVGAFSTCLESVYDQLRNLIFGALVPANYETCNKWQTFLHAISQHLSWLLAKSAGDVHTTLAADTESLVQRLASLMEEPVEVLPDDEKPNPLVVQVLWFLTEASCRLLCDRWRRMEEMDPTIVSTCIKALMSKLWDFTFGDSALPLDLSREGLLKPSEGQQIAELWICLLDLTSNRAFEGLFSPSRQSFWLLYLEVLQTRGLQAPQTDLRAREAMWRSIFTLCALSQFSLHGNSTMAPRLSASWQTIAAVLERAPLSADPAVDVSLSKRGLRKRDEYVRVLVSRCLWLNLKWHWRLDVDDASLVFNRLLDVFKSRRFANLADEPSDFPSFLRHSNLALLHESKRSDTAFTLFLKLVVRAADEMRKQNPQLAQATTIPPRLKKILSLAVPVGSVPFTKTTPPSAHELSMLYNRFSAVAVAVYLEPTVANLKYRLANARRYVNFKDTDNETRRACIRGAMHLGTLLRHLDLPLADILDWLGEMTNTLIDEYQAKEPGKGAADFAPLDNARRYIVVCIQLILGCVRHILETSSMNPEESRHKYPDPALLQGPWVTRVFSTATTLSSVLSTGDQIRRLVQAFLDARSLVIPKPRRPQPRVVAEDSQESQYDYDQFDLDLDDPELLAALGENLGDPEAIQNKEKDKIVCEIIDKHISPAIYRLVCKHFNDPVYKQTGELSFEDADRWIDCWVGCASVVVQNGKKDWDFYLSFGPQSWEKIIEPDWRRRVGLRFMYMLLQLDPPAYLASTDLFIEVLFQSMATPTITLEHEYMALLLSIDRLHHPLFHDLPIGAPGDDGDYHLSKHEFSDKRIAFLRVMFKNLTDSLVSESNGDHSLIARNQIHITTVSRFLETVQDIYDRLPPASVTHAAHRAFCKAVFTLLSEYPSLSNHARLAKHMNWLRGISQ